MKLTAEELADAMAAQQENNSLESVRRGVMPPRVLLRLETVQATAEARMAAFNVALRKVLPRLSAELARVRSGGMKKIEAVKRLRAAAAEFSRVGQAHSACAGRCTHCCHIPVAMFETEARLMGKALGRQPVKVTHSLRLEENAYGPGQACPFLNDGGCSIYEHRPLACRLHLNMDQDDLLCELVQGVSVPVPLANATHFHALYGAVCQDEVLADIREFFPAPPADESGH